VEYILFGIGTYKISLMIPNVSVCFKVRLINALQKSSYSLITRNGPELLNSI